MVTETMASFEEERTTIAADSSDSSDAKKTNNGGIEHNSHELNGENNNIRRVINDIGDMACIESSTKMEENQLNVLSSTASVIDDVKNGNKSSTSIEDNANAESISILKHENSVQLPQATDNAVNHVAKLGSATVTSAKHVSSDKSKSNSSTKRSSVDTKTGERTHHSSKSQSSTCGEF